MIEDSRHLHKNDLTFVIAGVSWPDIFDHKNKLGPRAGDDCSIARVQGVCDIVHLQSFSFFMSLSLSLSLSWQNIKQ